MWHGRLARGTAGRYIIFSQAALPPSFSLQKFLNIIQLRAVFMIEGRRVVTGEAILGGAATTDRIRNDRIRNDRSRVESSGDAVEALIEKLVCDHSQLVYRIAYAVLRSHHDAEDATQETFVRVLRYSSKLASVEDPKPWLARIAWRVAVDRSRQHGRTREVALDDPEKPLAEIASAETSAHETVQSAQVGAALEKLIAALPPKLREPLILSAIEDMSPREVAEVLRINEAAVRSRVFRARQILKEKMAQAVSRK
jgi:RNA polymerase sigma-70 factor, ECF subfamily